MKNGRLIAILAALAISGLLVSPIAMAADSLCARVKIEIKQELTLERQAFEARMKITNGTNMDMANLGVEVLFTDADGNPVVASSDPDHTSASFFIRVDTLENVSGVDGTGTVGAGVEARITWLIIPAPGTGGQDPNGQMYYVGAKLSYNLGGDDNETEVVPDYIFVRPMPSLTLDYFLPHEVYGDDPFTQETEPEIPFSLGVRITNSGYGPARSLKIDSGQPEIIENDLGLLIDFRIHATEVNGKPAINSLLADFGDIESMHSAVARWVMTASLSGTFVEFDATFTHADELGGKLTSLIQDPIHTHLLVRDVLVDLNGRDNSRDFLVKDDDFLRVYESEGGDHPVTDYSQDSGIAPGRGNLEYQMNVPLAPAAFLFAKLLDPQAGTMAIAYVERSDGKTVKPENAWLSKTSDRNGNWTYYINIFDFNREGSRADRGDNLYTVVYGAPVRENEPPVLGFIADKSVQATQFLGFLVEASDPDGATPSLEIDTLPGGATFTDNGNGTGSFSWNPLVVQTGVYHVIFTAYDSADRSANDAQAVTITVRSETGTPIVTFAQTASQGDEGTTPVNIEVKLDQPAPAGGVTVTYGIAGGSTAESPADFALPGTQLVFAEGEDTKTIALAIVDDALGEASETVILDLSSPVNATLGAPIRHTHTILESDGGPDVRYLLVGAGGANNGLFRFNADTGEFADDLAAGAGVDGPAGMMFGPDGSLYLASSASNKIYRWVSGTRGFQEFSAVPALDGPQGMTFGPDGGLYVANGTANQILRLDAATGSLLGVFSTASELNAPRGIVFGPDGHLYVCNSGTNQIVRIDSADGSFLDVFAEDSDLADPPDLVFGPDGDLYVSSRGSVNAVLRFEGLSGAYIDTFTSGTQPGRPAGLTFGPDGNLYVADETGDNVLRYDGGTGAFQDGFIAPIRATVTPGFLLFTNFAPTVETPPASQTVLVGQSVALSVGSAGSATLFHQWQKGGVDILGATSSLLVIPGAANGDAGEYRCVVSNGFGQATSPTAQVVVQALPQMQFTLTLSQVDENDGTVHVEVSQDAISPLDTTIGISVIGGTAIPDQNRVEPDFKLLVGSVTIVAGQTTAQADLLIYTDANPEDDETVVLELAGPTNAVLGTNTVHTMTIRDATTTPDPDSDGDGMLDAWEMHIIDAAPDDPFATIADVLPGDDFDADYATNLQEFTAGTDPVNPDSDEDGVKDGTEPDWNQDTDTDGLINALDTDSDGDGLSDGVEDANADGLIAGDTSNDRVLDAGETWTETDPINADTDSDGLPDGWEIAHNLDPFANDASLDPDTDGLDNAAEFANQTDPHVGDTDTDGLPDGWEVAHNLDPLTNDADLDPDTDGLDNAAEFANQTDPQAADTDSDGMSDRWEITRGFDPLDGISDLDGDTFSNLAEYQGGSDPRSAESLPVAHLSQVRRAAGNAGSIALGVAQFENGSTVLTGSFEGSLTLGGGARATAFTSRGGSDAWAACYAANGDLTWAVQAGGAGEDAGRDVHTFPDGSCVVVGGFSGTAEFHSPGMASVQLSAVGGRDVFVARYTPDGVLAWVRAAGGVDADTATGVVGLPDGRCVLTGEFTGQGAAFGVGGPNAATLASAGGTDIYLAWYDAEGTFLQAVRAGSSTDDLGSGIALGMDGTLLVVGQITGPTEFASAGDRSILDGEPAGDVFLAKYTADGTFVWARQAGGPGSDTALGIAALADGGILMTGTFSDTATFGPGDSNETDLTTFGQTDAFLARYDATGALVWARGVGGPGVDVGAAVAALPDGTALFTGDFEKDAAFGDGGAAILLSSEGDRDVFLARCDADGNVLSARRVGGPEHNQGSDIAVFLGGRVAVCGSFTGLALFGAGEPGAVALDSPGHESAFLARYGYLVYGIRTMAPAGGDMGVSIAAGLSMTADHAPTALEEIEVVHEKLDPYGPRYTFLMGRCQINVAEYVRFLNDLLATQDTMVPSAYVDPATGNLYFNERMTSESLLFEPDEANENGYFNYGIQYQAAGRDTAALYTYTPAWKDHPIVGVTWCGAVKYCNWLSRRKGLSPDRWCYSEGPELADWHPTHLAKGQWEDGFDEAERASWIARHPDGFRLPMDDYAAGSSAYNEFLKAVSWDGRVSRHRPQGTAFHLNYWEKQEEYHGPMAGEAGSPNYYGLKHALGNVWEWMNDGGESGDLSRRAIRGWGWRNSFENVQDMEGPRFRLGAVPSNASSAVGFRVVSVRDVQFRVQLSTSPDFAVRDLQERTLGESRTWHPELAPAQTYYWRVSAQYPTEGEPPPTTWFGADGGQDDPGWSSFATVSDMVVVDIPVQAAWNLISVPIESVSVRDLMDPGPGPLVFWTWDRLNAAYVQTDTIAPHSGYWFYAKTAGALRVKGMEVPDDEIPTRVGTGWNLIGVVNDILELDLEGISGVFRWDAVDRHHLVESEQLLRFIGYWIQVAPDTPEFILHEKAPRVGH